jgi:hypothetical protein
MTWDFFLLHIVGSDFFGAISLSSKISLVTHELQLEKYRGRQIFFVIYDDP